MASARRSQDGSQRAVPRPFLKWAGGKRQLLGQLYPLLPVDIPRYFEPFVGGGALFFSLATQLRRSHLADVNAELVNVYEQIRDHVDLLLVELDRHPHDKDHFYAVRALDPDQLTPVARAARTIYLNKTGFNGLYRVNSKGRFNVPFGRHTNPTIRDDRNLRACSQVLQGAKLAVTDFARLTRKAKSGDFVYFDPPYVPVSETSYFTAYARGGFGWSEQERLAEVFTELAGRGVHVMLSNSDVPQLHQLYRGFRIEKVSASRAINSNANARGRISEIVVLSDYTTRAEAEARRGA